MRHGFTGEIAGQALTYRRQRLSTDFSTSSHSLAKEYHLTCMMSIRWKMQPSGRHPLPYSAPVSALSAAERYRPISLACSIRPKFPGTFGHPSKVPTLAFQSA